MPRIAHRSHVAAALPALHEALTLWPDEDTDGKRAAESLRERLRATVRAALDAHPIRTAANDLGVSVSTLQRWQESGVL